MRTNRRHSYVFFFLTMMGIVARIAVGSVPLAPGSPFCSLSGSCYFAGAGVATVSPNVAQSGKKHEHHEEQSRHPPSPAPWYALVQGDLSTASSFFVSALPIAHARAALDPKLGSPLRPPSC